MNPHYASVVQRAAHRCEYCRAPEAVFNFPFEVEHILPSSREGANDVANLALACRSCNLFKADCVEAIDPLDGKTVLLFHPRRDEWHDHFRALNTGMIEGITPTGRATVAQLRMNTEAQITARRMWMRIGLYVEGRT
jgi:hypothetical protein